MEAQQDLQNRMEGYLPLKFRQQADHKEMLEELEVGDHHLSSHLISLF